MLVLRQGMPLMPQVTELIIAELLYLQYESATDPIFMYINSTGVAVLLGDRVTCACICFESVWIERVASF